ncbi:MAG: GxxExxY protein [Pirellulales bacterium]|nr:GxxExxY protein [Pirellulales bacterium]
MVLQLSRRGLKFEKQRPLPVADRGIKIDGSFRLDEVVEKSVIVEINAVDKIVPVHDAPLLTNMKRSDVRIGLLINFHTAVLK